MGDIAVIMVTGNLTKPAAGEATQYGTRVKFTVASSFYDPKSQGERPKNYYECTLFCNQERWGKIQQLLAQGTRLQVVGELKPRTTTDGEGKSKTWLNVEVYEFNLLGEGKAANAHAPASTDQLPAGWSQYADPSGRPYYVGPGGATQWTKPQATPPAPATPPPPATPPAAPPPGPPSSTPPPGHTPPPAPPGGSPI